MSCFARWSNRGWLVQKLALPVGKHLWDMKNLDLHDRGILNTILNMIVNMILNMILNTILNMILNTILNTIWDMISEDHIQKIGVQKLKPCWSSEIIKTSQL
jgi:hypothetical protein